MMCDDQEDKLTDLTMGEIYIGDEDAMREECRHSLRRLSQNSIIFHHETILDDASSGNRIGNDDVEVGDVLGRGGFSNVCEYKGLKSCSQSLTSVDGSAFNKSESISEWSDEAESTRSRSLEKKYYAVKRLRNDLSDNLTKTGALDLAIEAQFLNSLSHKNIVSLQAHGDDPGAKDFCIIIDRVERTLGEEMKSWRYRGKLSKEKNAYHPLLHSVILPFALDITSALSYLHGKNILFRDLKPENIGIDLDDNLKIFDFGLATELRPSNYHGRNKYRLEAAGTRRYMSPEVTKRNPYGLPADIFSFGILLNEMITQVKPFSGMGVKEHKKALLLFRRRPVMSKRCPKEIKKLIQSSWSHNPEHRPVVKIIDARISAYLENHKQSEHSQ